MPPVRPAAPTLVAAGIVAPPPARLPERRAPSRAFGLQAHDHRGGGLAGQQRSHDEPGQPAELAEVIPELPVIGITWYFRRT